MKKNIYREALIISQLNHPSILPFIGYRLHCQSLTFQNFVFQKKSFRHY